jgi:hypothetical protein
MVVFILYCTGTVYILVVNIAAEELDQFFTLLILILNKPEIKFKS